MAALWEDATVVGDAERGCVWLTDSSGARSAALWPAEGYTAKFEPLRIFAPNGEVVLSEYRTRDLGGGFSDVFIDRIPPECRTGDRAWWIAPTM